ncbi:hypothetical protein BCR41DRAFT_348507, partial [Lobosporangium transversale]
MTVAEKELQAFRLISLDGTPISSSDIKHVEARFDQKRQEYILLWNDILFIHKDAVHVENKGEILLFLTDDGFEYVKPLRIRAALDVVLDIVISSQTGVKADEPVISEANDAIIQNSQGEMYYYGKGVPQDYLKAFDWYLKAANQGYASAQYNLGYMYLKGKGVPHDYSTAFSWFLKAANQGDVDAQNALGDIYSEGKGVPRDYSTAFNWYLKAANQGDADAQNALGDIYYYANGVPQDYSKAIDWYLKAANQGNADAQYTLGDMHHNGDGVTLDYSKAIDWYLKAANQGNADAQ